MSSAAESTDSDSGGEAASIGGVTETMALVALTDDWE